MRVTTLGNTGTVFQAPDMTGFHFLAKGSRALLLPVCMKAKKTYKINVKLTKSTKSS